MEEQKRKEESQVVELDRPLARARSSCERQAHRDAHPEHLRQLDAAALVVDEVAVVERLQAEVLELEVARRDERRAEPLQIEAQQLRRQQLLRDALVNRVDEGLA